MANLQTQLYTQLSGYAGLSALVSTRIYPSKAPQTLTPSQSYVVYHQISERPIHSHQGYSSLREVRMQVSCMAKNYDAARAIAEQVKLAMDAWTWPQACLRDGDTELYDPESGCEHIALDFIIWTE